jgi:hypothetical protein
MTQTYMKQPDLWLGKHFGIDAYLSLIEKDDGTARILIKKPSGQVWAGEIEEIDRIPSARTREEKRDIDLWMGKYHWDLNESEGGE